MPDVHGQVTQDDFVAPTGCYRIMEEDMDENSGTLAIVADIHNLNFTMSVTILNMLRENQPGCIFTLCDQSGPIVVPD